MQVVNHILWEGWHGLGWRRCGCARSWCGEHRRRGCARLVRQRLDDKRPNALWRCVYILIRPVGSVYQPYRERLVECLVVHVIATSTAVYLTSSCIIEQRVALRGGVWSIGYNPNVTIQVPASCPEHAWALLWSRSAGATPHRMHTRGVPLVSSKALPFVYGMCTTWIVRGICWNYAGYATPWHAPGCIASSAVARLAPCYPPWLAVPTTPIRGGSSHDTDLWHPSGYTREMCGLACSKLHDAVAVLH